MFDEIAHLYDGLKADHDYGAEFSEVLNAVTTVGARLPRTMLDLGCGTGRLLAAAADVSRLRCGLDLSPRMIEVARRSDAKGLYCVGDYEHIPLQRRFDLVTCLGATAYAQGPQGLDRLARGIARHLEKGGTAAIKSWYSPEEWRPGATRIRRNARAGVTYTRMSRLADKGGVDFINIRSDTTGVEVIEQRQNTFLASVPLLGSCLGRAGLEWHVSDRNDRLVIARRRRMDWHDE